MPFTSTVRFPFWVGGVIAVFALVAGATGLLSYPAAAHVSLPGLLLLQDAGTGTKILSAHFLVDRPYSQVWVEDLYFARSASFPRYLAALVLSAALAAVSVIVPSDVVAMVGMIVCAVLYQVLAGVGLARSIRQAGREASQATTA